MSVAAPLWLPAAAAAAADFSKFLTDAEAPSFPGEFSFSMSGGCGMASTTGPGLDCSFQLSAALNLACIPGLQPINAYQTPFNQLTSQLSTVHHTPGLSAPCTANYAATTNSPNGNCSSSSSSNHDHKRLLNAGGGGSGDSCCCCSTVSGGGSPDSSSCGGMTSPFTPDSGIGAGSTWEKADWPGDGLLLSSSCDDAPSTALQTGAMGPISPYRRPRGRQQKRSTDRQLGVAFEVLRTKLASIVPQGTKLTRKRTLEWAMSYIGQLAEDAEGDSDASPEPLTFDAGQSPEKQTLDERSSASTQPEDSPISAKPSPEPLRPPGTSEWASQHATECALESPTTPSPCKPTRPQHLDVGSLSPPVKQAPSATKAGARSTEQRHMAAAIPSPAYTSAAAAAAAVAHSLLQTPKKRKADRRESVMLNEYKSSQSAALPTWITSRKVRKRF